MKSKPQPKKSWKGKPSQQPLNAIRKCAQRFGLHRKNALSPSGFKLYRKDKQEYFRQYVLGIRPEASQAMLAGRLFSDCFEDRRIDPVKECEKRELPKRYGLAFREALMVMPDIGMANSEVEMTALYQKMQLYGVADGWLPAFLHIVENKTTGDPKKWTQAVIDEDAQLTIYALIVWLVLGVVPKRITLNVIDTRKTTQKRVWSYSTKRTVAQLKAFMPLLDEVIEGIAAGDWGV